MKLSFRKKIFWSFAVLAIVGSIVSMSITVVLLLRQSEQEAKQRISEEEKNLLSLGVMDFISLVEYRDFLEQIPTSIPSEQLNEVIHIYIPPGSLLYTNQPRSAIQTPEFLGDHVNRGFYDIYVNGRGYLGQLRSYKTSDGKTLWLEIATPRTSSLKRLQSVGGLFVVTLLGLLGLSFLFSYWLGQKISAPIESFALEMSKLESKDIKLWKSLSIEYKQMNELKPIAKAFDVLKDRLQQTFIRNEYLGRFIAHEIRTPLTVIQGEIEIAMENRERSREEVQLTQSILEEVKKISDVVGTVLKVPSGDRNSTPIVIDRFDLSKFLPQCFEELKKTYSDIVLEMKHPPVTMIDTDPYLFTMLLSNLIRNALQHSQTKNSVMIRTSVDHHVLAIDVIDQGKGLPNEVLIAANSENVFDQELGIGLILSKQIADLLRMKLTFENLTNQGLRVRISSSVF